MTATVYQGDELPFQISPCYFSSSARLLSIRPRTLPFSEEKKQKIILYLNLSVFSRAPTMMIRLIILIWYFMELVEDGQNNGTYSV
jgi:hypothetical protein